ncbi:hypothetical protein TRFO_39060 [Tritrichomonas foetus]|uniref:Coiled-coil domain-containing protein 39 n=1 Tax=Tritrichomonas foetus TaxID=1144522 RepID=A0A1J4JAU0_9EUKA|nr:hypothetical protein TRFO_39060 [Tritrichomonas foetus]|eukprot:OHS94771.1 hypothetical protein TRFO_39060 [Tritrichomonas foetus]
MAFNSGQKISEIRRKKEDKLHTKQIQFYEASDEYANIVKTYEKMREELEKLNNSLRDMEEKHQNEISNVVIMRRMAYKTEDDVKRKELEKQDQDYFINKLMEKMADLTQKIYKIEDQIIAQREETKKAQIAVYQASFEDSRMNFEREQLLKDWDSAVIGVKFRIISLERIQSAVEEQELEMMALNNEIAIIKNHQNEQKSITENQLKVMKRMEDRINHISNKIEEIQKQRKKLEDQSESIGNKIMLKQHQLNVLFDERLEAKKEFEKAIADAHKLGNQVHDKEEKRENRSRQQSRHARDVANLQRAAIPLKRQLELRKQELVNLQNEKVRSNLAKLTLDNQCAIYQKRLEAIQKELKENEEMFTQLESEHKGNKNQIEQNLKKVELLNQKYESIKSANNAEDLSPLELKIRDIRNKITECTESASQKQSEWIKMQTNYVQLSQMCEKIDKEVNESKSEIGIVQRKVDRKKAQLEDIQKENQKYQIHIKVFENEIIKLNKKTGGKVQIPFDQKIVDALQEKEKEAAEIESQIAQKYQQKREIEEEKHEVDRILEVWEKKIKMVDEMEKNFDRTKNEQELQLMKNEVRRLEESLAKIKVQQRKIVEQMQMALRRRERCKTPDVAANDQVINEGIQRLKEMKETQDEESIISESLAKLQMMKEEPELASKDDDLEAEQLEDELYSIEDQIEIQEKEIKAEVKAQKELMSELEEINEVVDEFEKQKYEFERMIKDQNLLNKNLNSKLDRVNLRVRYFHGKQAKGEPNLTEEFDKIQRQMIDMTMLLDSMCFQFPELADQFHEVQSSLVFD